MNLDDLRVFEYDEQAGEEVDRPAALADIASLVTSNLLGVTEIAERLGVKPNTVSQWRLRNIGFPDPLVDLSMGPVWWAADVDEWQETRRLRSRSHP